MGVQESLLSFGTGNFGLFGGCVKGFGLAEEGGFLVWRPEVLGASGCFCGIDGFFGCSLGTTTLLAC